MGLFSFIFGGDQKLALIRELLAQRMRDSGFDGLEKELSNSEVFGTPEAAIVVIIVIAVKMQRGIMLKI